MQATSNQLREMVRDILREVVPPRQGASVETVRIASDADLANFVQRVLAAQEAVKSGRLHFTLASAPAAVPASAAGALLQGVITEQIVDRHASAGMLHLAADAVITPLGRDRARKLGLKIERRR
jgi:hypothetical protein